MRASLIVIFKCWLKTKPRALYIWEKGTTFNPKLRFVVFHSIAFSTKPNIIGLPTKTMFQPENSNTQKKYEIVSYYCDGVMEGMTPDYVEHYFDVISRGEEETLPRYNKERHVQKYGAYAKRYLYVPKEHPTKQNPSDSFKHMFWW